MSREVSYGRWDHALGVVETGADKIVSTEQENLTVLIVGRHAAKFSPADSFPVPPESSRVPFQPCVAKPHGNPGPPEPDQAARAGVIGHVCPSRAHPPPSFTLRNPQPSHILAECFP